MQKVIKLGDLVIVSLDTGEIYQRNNLTKEELDTVINSNDCEEIKCIMSPSYKEDLIEYNKAKAIEDRVRLSKYLSIENHSIYWKEISLLSIPVELAEAILKAEFQEDSLKVETYKNFWTLMSLNTNEECRKNLFWFLNRNGLVISRCGFFVAYRNAELKFIDTDGKKVFTDAHSHTTRIKIGDMVTLPKEQCDCDSSHECSRGLHCASSIWLKHNYFGDTGLVVLVNPAEVVAVPYDSEYGKLRTCAYLPIDFAQFDDNGNVIPYNVEDGFECEYVPKVIYEGLMGTEEDSNYKIIIPDSPEINKNYITDSLLEIAKDCIIARNK